MPRSMTIRWINSPAETVFTSIRDLRVSLQIAPHIRVVEWSAAIPHGVGETGVLRAGRRELVARISNYAENRLLELEITSVEGVTCERLELASEMGGTRIVHTTETVVHAAAPARRRLPPTQRAIAHMLSAIKDLLERTNGARIPAVVHRDERLRLTAGAQQGIV